jgi:hypothetical protein
MMTALVVFNRKHRVHQHPNRNPHNQKRNNAMTSEERRQFEEMRRDLSDQKERIVKLEGANRVMNERVLKVFEDITRKPVA